MKSKAPGEGGSTRGRDDTLNFEQMLIAEWLPASGTLVAGSVLGASVGRSQVVRVGPG